MKPFLFQPARAAVRILAVFTIILALTACNAPRVPLATATPAGLPVATDPAVPSQPTPTAETVTAIPFDPTPTPQIEPSPTLPALDPTPTQTDSTQDPGASPQNEAPVITRDNLSGLSEQTFGLPGWVNAFLWPEPGMALPGVTSPYPNLLLQSEDQLFPILLDPMGLGMPLTLPLNGTQPLAFSPNGTSLVIKDPSRTALYSLSGPLLRELPQPANAYLASYSSDGRYLVVGSGDAIEAYVYDLTSGADSAPVRLSGFELAAPMYTVLIAPGGHTIAWLARATLQLQDVASGALGARFDYPDFISIVAFSPDGSKLAVAVGLELKLYATADGAQITQIPLSSTLSSLSWSPDGQLLAAGALGSLEIFDGANLTPLISLPGPNSSTYLVGFSPDGRYIVSTHDAYQFGVWRTQ